MEILFSWMANAFLFISFLAIPSFSNENFKDAVLALDWPTAQSILENEHDIDPNVVLFRRGPYAGVHALVFLAIHERWDLINLIIEKWPETIEHSLPLQGPHFGKSLLWHAARKKDKAYVEKILNKAPRSHVDTAASVGDDAGSNPLWWLTFNQNWEAVKQHIESGDHANINASLQNGEHKGKSVLWLVALYKQWDIVEAIINKCENANFHATAVISSINNDVFDLLAQDNKFDLIRLAIFVAPNMPRQSFNHLLSDNVLLKLAHAGEWDLVEHGLHQGSDLNYDPEDSSAGSIAKCIIFGGGQQLLPKIMCLPLKNKLTPALFKGVGPEEGKNLLQAAILLYVVHAKLDDDKQLRQALKECELKSKWSASRFAKIEAKTLRTFRGAALFFSPDIDKYGGDLAALPREIKKKISLEAVCQNRPHFGCIFGDNDVAVMIESIVLLDRDLHFSRASTIIASAVTMKILPIEMRKEQKQALFEVTPRSIKRTHKLISLALHKGIDEGYLSGRLHKEDRDQIVEALIQTDPKNFDEDHIWNAIVNLSANIASKKPESL